MAKSCVSVCRELCVVSSAWQKAVPELLDNIDTYPGLSSDWAEGMAGYGEAQVGLLQNAQRHMHDQLTRVIILACSCIKLHLPMIDKSHHAQ